MCLSPERAAEAEVVVVQQYEPPLDVTAPLILLLGDGQRVKLADAAGTLVMVRTPQRCERLQTGLLGV